MAIFSRRDVQAMLNRLADSLSTKQLKDLVGKLNDGDPDEILATEWEVVVLSAFRQAGRIQYERNFGGRRKPDLFFQMGQSGKFEFTVDITTISDANAHDTNPYEEFRGAIQRFLKKQGHNSAGLDIDVAHEKIGEFRDSKIKLLLPPKGEIDQFVKTELNLFLSTIAKEPDKDAVYSHNQNGIRFSIRYNSKEKRFSSGRCISYTVPYSRRRNSLNNALKKKADQLSKSGYTGPRGVIICDGNCDALKERNAVAGAHGCREIITPFLKSHKSILFILVLCIEQRHGMFYSNRSIQIAPKLYRNPTNDHTLLQLTSTLDRMLNSLPTPESTPGNALRWLGRNKTIGRPLGEISMQGDTIKISARALTELLAGKIELKQFLEDHNLKPIESGQRAFPFFEWQMQSGHTLKNAFVEPAEHKDDDLIVFEYAGPDPAISPYRVPNSPKI